MTNRWDGMGGSVLRLNLVLTQLLFLLIAWGASLYRHGGEWTALFVLPPVQGWVAAGGAALLVICVSVTMDRVLPPHWLDDSGVNERIFAGVSVRHAAALCALVGLGEEWLFRGVILPLAGNIWTSLLFTLMHARYWRRPLLWALVYGISYLLGLVYERYGSLWPPVLAHTLIDFVLALYLMRLGRRRGG